VVDQNGSTAMTSGTMSYANQIQVYQTYFPLPKGRFWTEKGWNDLSYVVSCFLVGGLAIGVIVRAGEGITDSSWWIVPVYVG
jgi:glutathionylspermidine synthase